MTQMPKNLFTKNLFKKQKYDKLVQIKMTNDNYEFLKFMSKKLDLTMSEIVREALSLYLNIHN